MPRYLLYTLLFLCGTAAYRHTPATTYTPQADTAKKHAPYYDTSKIVVFPFYPKAKSYYLRDAAAPMVLYEYDFAQTEEILRHCIDEDNKRIDTFQQKINLDKYKRQYIPYVSKKGHRMIWVNCICDYIFYGESWKTGIIQVSDGGSCYFNVNIDLTDKQCYNLSINGEG